MVTTLSKKNGPADTYNDRRIEKRTPVNLSVDLTRFSSDGNAITEHTRIEDISSVGCRFRSQVEFRRGDVVSIRYQDHESPSWNQPQLFEVMWAAPQGVNWNAGARKLEGEKLANFKHPQASKLPPYTSR